MAQAQTQLSIPQSVQDFIASASVFIIGGEEVRPTDRELIPTVNPATEEVITEVPQATAEDVDRAVQAAVAAHQSGVWRTLNPSKRARILAKVADLIRRDAEQLAWLETLDNGKPLKHALGEVLQAAYAFQYFAGWVDKPDGVTIPSRANRFTYSVREPVGVCGLIVPWNFPTMTAANKLAPALAFGNPVVLKPSEITPLSAVWLVRLLQEAGVPAGVVNLVQGVGPVTGQALVDHANVDKISFTGSTKVGRSIMRSSAEHLHKVTLELGGKSPNIVFADARNLDRVAKRVASACFYNAGQVCIAGARLLVEEKIRDEFVAKVVDAARATTVAPGWHDASMMGPLVSSTHFARVKGYVDEAVRDGAEVVVGGGRVDTFERGYFYQPTIVTQVRPGMTILAEEVFGPVLTVESFADEDEAVAKANDVQYGLAAALWSQDVSRIHRVSGKLDAGTVWVNTYAEMDASVSVAGFKQSGLGLELGPYAVETFTRVKSVQIAL